MVMPSDSLVIEGKVLNKCLYRLSDFDTFPAVSVPDQVIYNHKGEIKSTITGIKGIPIKRLLATVRFDYPSQSPSMLNEFYFIFIATDGYKVVFSWNEIYNTKIGDAVFLIVGMDGKSLSTLNQRLLLMSTMDLKTGRRYIKGLSKIDVRRLEE